MSPQSRRSAKPRLSPRPVAAFAMGAGLQRRLFGEAGLLELAGLLAIDAEHVIADFAAVEDAVLAELDVLVTGWFGPPLTEEALARMPRLRAVIHAGGSVKAIVPAAAWERGIRVTSAASANALPVAEYALAMVLLAAKRVLPIARAYGRAPETIDVLRDDPGIGGYRAVVGVVGASRTGRALIRLLKPFGFEVVVADPYLDEGQARELGVEWVSLDELLERSQIVSLHAPELPETRHLIGMPQLRRMRPGATLINTARPALVDEEALVAVLAEGAIDAVLDVTDPEPLPAGHPLFTLPNAFVTPHLAGSQGSELLLLGDAALDEIRRFVEGRPPAHPVFASQLVTTA